MSTTGPTGTDPADEPARPDAAGAPEPNDTIDFFGASPPPTLPVPTTPAPAAPEPPAASGPTPEPAAPVAGPVAGPAPASPAVPIHGELVPAAPDRPRRGVRIRTLVFGVVLLVVSATCLVSLLTKIAVDFGVLGLAVLVGAGASLFVGGLSAAVADIRRGGSRYS